MESIGHVEGLLNYLDRNSEKPVAYMYKPPEGVAPRSGTYVKFAVPIYNAREIAGELSLDKQGFTLAHQKSAVTNFYDADEVRAVYYPEVERLVKEITGAVKVHVFDHNVRNRAMADQGTRGVQGPVRVAHNDYTLKSGPQRVRDLLPDEADELLKNRFAVINVWRPIHGPVEESPLAVCDAASMVQQDFVPQDLKYQNRTGEVYSVAYNPNHRWFYFPKMQQTEVMLLKCYDSDPHHTRFTARSAFEDPTSPPNAPPRESIEVRTLVFFPKS
ncbi:MAG: CmcJ/NvfI family oxidoreductase [Candidatus Binataceae bacterium]